MPLRNIAVSLIDGMMELIRSLFCRYSTAAASTNRSALLHHIGHRPDEPVCTEVIHLSHQLKVFFGLLRNGAAGGETHVINSEINLAIVLQGEIFDYPQMSTYLMLGKVLKY